MSKQRAKTSSGHSELARVIEDTLAVLASRAPAGPVPQIAPPAPLPSLLERCEALLERGALDHAPLRIVHSFGGPVWPGDMVAQLPNVRLIRSDFAKVTISGGHFSGLLAEARGKALTTVIDGLDGLGGRPVLWYDHALGQGEPLPIVRRRVRGVVVVRHPFALYLAAQRAGCQHVTLEEFSAAYLSYVDTLGDLPRVKQEDLMGDPVAALASLARALHLEMPADLTVEIQETEEPVGPIATNHDAGHLVVGPSYRSLCHHLDYAPGFDPVKKRQAKAQPALPMAPVQWAFLRPELPIVIACHHKSGTNFLRKVFQQLATVFGMPIWMKFYDAAPESGWQICFHQHSRITDLLAGRTFRGLHCVRHPKSLIYSAALYHEKCKEPWVDVPLQRFTQGTFAALTDRDFYNVIKDPKTPMPAREQRMVEMSTGKGIGPDFAGRSYREMLQGAGTIEAKLLVEMRGFSRGVVWDMVRFPVDQRFHQITLEAISRDPEMTALRAAFVHLGFKGAALEKCLEIAAPHCLWNVDTLPTHATTGVSDEWRSSFNSAASGEYQRLFGAAEEALGYAL